LDFRIRPAVWPLIVAAAAAGCSSDSLTLPSEGLPAAMAVVSGGGQTAQVATPLPDSLLVRVTDSESRPVEGVKVAFTPLLGGGDALPDTGVTNADGRTGTRWVLGTSAGAQRMQAMVVGQTLSGALVQNFDATALAAAADTVFAVRGNDQSGIVGGALTDSLVVRVTDRFGNPVSGSAVAWAVIGGGSVSPAGNVTDLAGAAATARVLGTVAGPQGATATVALLKGSPVAFSMTALPAPPTALIKVSGDNQVAAAGAAVAESLVVRLLDAAGNGVPGRNVTIAVATGGGSASPTSLTTDTGGRVATRWTLGPLAGLNTLIASSSGFSVTFQATATSATATTIAANSTTSQSDTAGLPVAAPPSVRVTDANGNPVAGVAITFAVTGGGGTILPVTSVSTSAAGVATLTSWTLGSEVGVNTVTASGTGLTGSPVTFTATGVAGVATQLAVQTQPSGAAQSGVAFAVQPAVRLADAFGNTVPTAGTVVTAALASGTGTLGGTLTASAVGGVATFSNLAITGAAGTYTLQFTSGALSPVTSAGITIGAGAAVKLAMVQQPSATAQNAVAFATQPTVQLQDAANNPVAQAGVVITAGISTGGGTLGGTLTATTNAGGLATFTNLSITGLVGARTLSFASTGLTPVSSTSVTITAGAPTQMTVSAGNGQSATAGSAVPIPPSVIVRDVSNNPVSGVSVTFAVAGGGGSVVPVTAVTTTAAGIAAVTSWTLGSAAGANTLTADAAPAGITGDPVTFTATAVAGTAGKLAMFTQPSVTAASGAVLATAPVVQLQDINSNPVATSNVPVTATIASGPGGTLAGALALTDPNGRAAFTSLSITGPVGVYALQFNGTNLTGVTSSAITLNAGAATQLAVISQPDTARSGIAFATAPTVQVQDAAGNAVGGPARNISVTKQSGTAVLTGTAMQATNASGLATFPGLVLTGVVGPNALLFSTAGLTADTTSTIALTSGTASLIAANSVTTQSDTVGLPVAVPPSVLVRDLSNNPVAGVAVTFTVTGGGGSRLPATPVPTNASGIATLTSWTLGGTAGTNTVTATVTGLTGSPVTFTATGVAGAATQITANSVTTQSDTVGLPVAVLPSVLVRDAGNNPVAGVSVTFTVAGGGGSRLPATPVVTNASGIATLTSWTLGGTAGTNTLTATVAGLTGSPVTFTATGVAGVATQITANSVTTQSDTAGLPVAAPPSVLVRDVNNNPVAGVAVTFAVTAGGGSILPATSVQTNASGIATLTSWTLGGTAGANTLTATVVGLAGSPVTFTATGVAGTATQIAANSVTTQSDTAGLPVAVPPSVLVRDAGNNPVAGVSVTFTVTGGGGSRLPATPVLTNASGIAALTSWTLGAAAGTNTLTATAAGLTGSPVTFTATGVAGAATQITANSVTTQSDTVGLPVAVLPSVLVRDAGNNPVAGVAVTFAVIGGGGSILPVTPVVTNASGVAMLTSWTLGVVAGPNTLTATVAGLTGSPVTFTATGVAGAATQIAANSVTTQSDTAGLPVAAPPSVLVRDASNNPVAGVAVTFAVTAGGGAILPAAPVLTNASGIATLTSWTLGGTAGANTLTATVAGLAGSPVTFTATGVAGAATQIAANSVATQSDTAGLPVAAPPSVLVRDASNNPVAGVAVTFTVTGGGGSRLPATPVSTNAAGVATLTSWTLGAVAGTNTLTATAVGLAGSPVTFTATGVAGAATQITANSVTTQSDTVGLPVAVPPSVLVRDVNNNPVAGVAVTFAVTAGGGTILPAAPVLTSASGIATLTSWTLGGLVGTNTVTATATGLAGSPVTFTATGVAGAATQIAANSVTTQSDTAGLPVAAPPSVLVRDAGNNPVAGVAVTFAVTGGGGSILPVTPVLTNASGIATLTSWTLGGTAGTNTVTATVTGLTGSPVTFTATGLTGAATQIAANSATTQSDTVGLPVAVPPSVLVRDAGNNPVAGVAVTFAVTGGGGSILPATPVITDASGIATLTSWTLGDTARTYTVTATATGLSGSPVTFTATGTAGAPAALDFSVQPTDASAGGNIAPPVRVRVLDAKGNLVSTATTSVTLAIGNNPAGGTLNGTTTQLAAVGVAVFSGLSINIAGTGYTLIATATGLVPATSAAFNITP